MTSDESRFGSTGVVPRDPNRVRWAMLRQIALFGGLAVGIVLCFWTGLTPFVRVSWVDFAKAQESLYRWKDPELKDLPLREYIKEETQGRTLPVEGQEWLSLVTKLRSWSEVGALPEPWRDRVMDESYYRGSVYFRPDEQPIAEVMPQIANGEIKYLVHPEAGYISVDYNSSPEGPGLMYSGTQQPNSFLYPYRTIGLFVIAAAVLAGILIPWTRKVDGLVNIPMIRVLPMVLVGLLLGVFFVLPFLIVGGSVETVTEAFPITLVCWLFLIGGLMVVYYTVKTEAVSIAIGPDGLRISSLSAGVEDYAYGEIQEIRGLVLRPPKWIAISLVLAAPVAPTTGGTFLALGQAALVSASQGGGFRIVARDGRSVCIWFTDQMGGVIFRNFDQLLETFEAKNLPVNPEPEVIQAFFPPDR